MLYLITGVPGSGKTLKMISDLMTRKDLKDRPLYLDGIPDVKQEIIPHLTVPEGETMQTWHKWAPTGAILVIDECQRVFRPMPSGSKIPDYIAELETHRHRGIDIFLLTQHPRLIHANVRSLIGHHCHISKTSLGVRRMVEWERCANPEANSDIANGVKSIYKLDKKAFGVYKSSEQHTKINTKRSRVIYILPIVIAMIIYGGWNFYSKVKSVDSNNTKELKTVTSPAEVPASASYSGNYPVVQPQPEPQKQHLTEDDYKPRVDGMPHTAPIYDSLNKSVKTMPYPVACVKSENRCTCYTEQATPIKEMKKSQCLDFVKNGIYNPYKESRTVENTARVVEEAEQGQVLVMGGKSQPNLMYDNLSRDFGSQNGAIVGGL